MSGLFSLAVAPILILCVYMYIRDKYEKEPIRLLVVGIVFGIVITFPIIQAQYFTMGFMPLTNEIGEAAYVSFVVAGVVEEAFKFAVLLALTWRNRNLNEPLDGIVYAVFISLGFAGMENVLYVFNPEIGGLETGLLRAFTSVPAHMMFGVSMGYYFARARLFGDVAINMIKAFFSAVFLHGAYNFFLLSGIWWALIPFTAFFGGMLVLGVRKINKYVRESPFRPAA